MDTCKYIQYIVSVAQPHLLFHAFSRWMIILILPFLLPSICGSAAICFFDVTSLVTYKSSSRWRGDVTRVAGSIPLVVVSDLTLLLCSRILFQLL